MSTAAVELNPDDGWQELVDSTDATFLIENYGGEPIFLAYGSTTPSISNGHRLEPGNGMVRLAPGKVYGKSASKSIATLLVSK